MSKSICILYFSGTDNTEIIVELLVNEFKNYDLHNINYFISSAASV